MNWLVVQTIRPLKRVLY